MIALVPLLQMLGDVIEPISRHQPLFPGSCNGRRLEARPIRAAPMGGGPGPVFNSLAEEAHPCRSDRARAGARVSASCGRSAWPPPDADLDVGLVNGNRPAVRLAKGP